MSECGEGLMMVAGDISVGNFCAESETLRELGEEDGESACV